MDRSEIISEINKYKDRPVEVAINGGGDFTVYGNMEGHWLFDGGDYLISVNSNVQNPTFGRPGTSQNEFPFTILSIEWADVVYVKSWIGNTSGDISSKVSSYTPIGTDKSISDIIKELESNSIRKAQSTAGFGENVDMAPSGAYGTFKGTYVSTNGKIPRYIEDMINK